MKAVELEHFFLSRRLRKAQDLQALLWSKRGTSKVTDVFDLLDSNLFSAYALEHSSCVGEEVSVVFAVIE